MGQQAKYLLIGSGRVAKHMAHYFTSLGLSFETWNRSQREGVLAQHARDATHILILIKDFAIEEMAQSLKTNAFKIHFSGSLVTPHAHGAHPLMTFGLHLYEASEYPKIPFVIDNSAPAFGMLMPGLPNPAVVLDYKKKAKYHAMCVIGGNFSCILWQKVMDTFVKEFGIPPSTAHMFMMQQAENLVHDYKNALTGPLTRGDEETIEANLKALEGDPYHDVYQSIVKAWRSENQ